MRAKRGIWPINVHEARRTRRFGGGSWIDVFEGANDGLIVAEIELDSEDQGFSLPPWVGEEVSGDARYLNSSLAINPYSNWSGEV